MSQTRGVRKVATTPPTQDAPVPHPSAPPTSNPSTSPSTGSSSSVRGGKDGTAPSSGPPATVPPPPIKTVDEVNANDLHGAIAEALIVRLKSDAEGVTQAQRDEHMMKIQRRSQPYMTGSGTKYPGIETKIVTLFPAYIGYFHPDVVKEIKSSREVKSVTENQFGEKMALEPCSSWGPSRVTLSDGAFDGINAAGKGKWLRNTDQMGKLGEGVTICIIDCDGFLCNDFEEDRIVYSQGGDHRIDVKLGTVGVVQPVDQKISTSLSHATIVANTACGTEFGMAPKASAFVYSSPTDLPSSYHTLVAFEKIARLKTSGHVILNMSWGFEEDKYLQDMRDALQFLMKLNVIPVVSAGNAKSFIDNTLVRFPQDLPGVIVVGNTDQENKLRPSSNFGPKVDVYAPGTEIPAKNNPKVFSGTSFSAPLVCGFLANLLSSEAPGKLFSVEEIRNLLRTNYSRATDTWRNPNNGQTGEVRTITSFMQASSVKPTPSLVPLNIENTVLSVSLTAKGASVLVPLDSKTHWVNQDTLNQLLGAVADNSSSRYAMFVKNALSSNVNPKDSFAALKQVKIEHDVAADGDQENRANAILTRLKPLIDHDNPPLTRTVLSCSLK